MTFFLIDLIYYKLDINWNMVGFKPIITKHLIV